MRRKKRRVEKNDRGGGVGGGNRELCGAVWHRLEERTAELLRKYLRSIGAKRSGKKAVLVERVEDHMRSLSNNNKAPVKSEPVKMSIGDRP